MASEVILPRQGQSVESCIIASWHVEEGDTVEVGQVICEVETDKASFEVEATASGTVVKRYFGEDDDVPVLTTLAMIGEAGESVPETPPTVGGSPGAGGSGNTGGDTGDEKAAPKKAAGVPAGSGKAAPGPATDAKGAASRPREGGSVEGGSAGGGSPMPVTGSGKLRISPRARQYAERAGVDPADLQGSGPGGRIIVRDVEAAAEGEQAPSRAQTRATTTASEYPGPVEEVALKGVRKITAERMLASLQNTAQLTLNRSADVRALLSLRARLKEREDPAISINDMVLFAVSRALTEHPEMNAHFEGGTLRKFAAVHLGFAVDTDRGLFVPTIRNADSLSLRALGAETRRLASLCKSGKAGAEELAPATFTTTNLGALGIESFTPVLNPPQIGILGISSVVPVPRLKDGVAEAGSIRPDAALGPDEVEWVPSISLSLTIDHQGIDGAPAARFLKTVAELIADFDLTLTQ